MSPFRSHMDRALALARAAADRGEVPVGAVVAGPDGRAVAEAGNRMRETGDPTAHAEMLAIRAACAATGADRLAGHALYVTLEPCAMCAGAIAAARIDRLYYGAADPKSGGVAHGARVFSHPQCHHRPEVYDGLAGIAAEALLKDFFARLRQPPATTQQGTAAMSDLLHVIARFRVNPDRMDDLLASLRILIPEVEAERGCLRYELMRSVKGDATLVFVEEWASRADWEAHNDGAALAAHRARVGKDWIEDVEVHAVRPL